MKKSLVTFLSLLAIVTVIASLSGLGREQVLSVFVFSILILGTLTYWRFRLAFGLVGLGLLLGLGLINVAHLVEFAGLDIILFLVGMMIVVGYLEERRFFETIVERIVRVTGTNASKLLIILMLMSGLFAALVDEVTSILFMAATIFQITGRYRLNPVPFLIMVVFATNIGSSATVVGNPVGVMIALRGGLAFSDFLRWATPISIMALFLTILISMKYFSKDIEALSEAMKTTGFEDAMESNEASGEETGEEKPHDIKLPAALFLGTIASLLLHRQIEEILLLEKNAMLLGTALIAAGITLFLERDRARELVERRVDWWTLSFFLILFSAVGTLQFVGVTSFLASGLFSIAGGDPSTIFFVFSITAAVLTGFMDNVLAVATFIPIVRELGELGVQSFPLWWGMLFAGTFFGNLTIIGSTANIVAIGMMERRKQGHITFVQWIKPGLVVSIPTLLLALLITYYQIPLMPA
ncbi:MAG: hypothetical protein HY619_04995 [Thaumarchaeota archaeon]|nr:hypothetical protein [Nitrososphaerota archaeon]